MKKRLVFEKETVLDALNKKIYVREAAEHLGISYQHLYTLIYRYNIDKVTKWEAK